VLPHASAAALLLLVGAPVLLQLQRPLHPVATQISPVQAAAGGLPAVLPTWLLPLLLAAAPAV
jgi:hypothetical protein